MRAGGGGAEKTLAGSVGARSIFRRCQSPRLSADEKEGNSEAASSEFSLFLASRLPTAASALQLLQPLHLKLEEGRCLYIELNALTAAVQTELKRLRRENQLATKTPTVRARLFAGEGAQRVALEARLEFKVFKQPPKTPGEKEAASGGGGEKTETQLSVKATLPSAPQGQQSASASERSSPFSGMPLVDDALGQPNSLSAASLQPKRRQWRLSVDCLSLRLFPADGDALPADRRALLRSVYVQCEYTPFAAEHKFTTATIDCSSEKAVRGGGRAFEKRIRSTARLKKQGSSARGCEMRVCLSSGVCTRGLLQLHSGRLGSAAVAVPGSHSPSTLRFFSRRGRVGVRHSKPTAKRGRRRRRRRQSPKRLRR